MHYKFPVQKFFDRWLGPSPAKRWDSAVMDGMTQWIRQWVHLSVRVGYTE